MELKFSKINGTNRYLNYDALKDSIISKLQPTCNEAEVIVLNRFPVAVTSQSSIDFIVLLNIPNAHRSWYQVISGDEKFNVKNQIIAVSVINDFSNSKLSIDGDQIETEQGFISIQEDASKIKYGLTNYLADKCYLTRNHITVHPLIWVINKEITAVGDNFFIGDSLTYEAIEKVIKKNYYFKYAGYIDWHNNNLVFEQQIRNIFEQASKDCKEGFITKKKIDRIQRKLGSKQQEAQNHIGNKLVEVKGKAGTGKTSELLKWMLQNSIDDQRGVFLTYNHLLVYDITAQVKSFSNRLSEDVIKVSTTTNTIHGYFYNVAKKLGVLLLLTEERIKELTIILDKRWNQIEAFFNQERKPKDTSLQWLKMRVQTHWKVNEGIKREAILFIQHIENLRYLPDETKTSNLFKIYRNDKIERLSNLESSNVFLKDYTAVLERVRQATSNLDAFLKDMDVVSKYDLIQNALNLNNNILDKDESGKIDFDKLKTRYKKSIGGFRAGRKVYIDEAQDCHPYERDILFNLFGSNNCVIANGDKEQLIRYSQICDWHLSQGKPIDVYVYKKPSKSFRMKPAIAALANHIAEWYNIDLNIEPLDTEDHGQVFISTSNSVEEQIKIVEEFHKIGERQGCTSYESLLLLKNAQSGSKGNEGNSVNPEIQSQQSVKVNEYNNIVNDNSVLRTDWNLVEMAQQRITDAFFWNTTGNVDKRKLSVPGSLSIRSIYYESCRGIEAWSVMCFNLDSFFEDKKNEDDADNYLLNSLFDQLTPDKRKEMYAATWILMAITRCMENCYIQLTNPQSSIYQCIKDFSVKNKNFVTRTK